MKEVSWNSGGLKYQFGMKRLKNTCQALDHFWSPTLCSVPGPLGLWNPGKDPTSSAPGEGCRLLGPLPLAQAREKALGPCFCSGFSLTLRPPSSPFSVRFLSNNRALTNKPKQSPWPPTYHCSSGHEYFQSSHVAGPPAQFSACYNSITSEAYCSGSLNFNFFS